jgi:acetylornithine deacetylase
VRGAEAHNQIPAEASAILDVRLAPGLQAESVIEAVRGVVTSEVEVVSTRLRSYAMPEGAPFWECLPPDRFVSRTMTDQVFFQGIPAVKLGPGQTERSHTVDEFVLVSELEAGVAAYRSLIERFVEMYG